MCGSRVGLLVWCRAMLPFKLTRPQSIAWGFALVALHTIVGHFLAPFGLLLTMGVVPALVLVIISARPHFSAALGCTLFYIFFAMSDILQKLYAGGNHDGQGAGWLFMTTMIGLVVSAPFILVWLKELPTEKLRTKTLIFVLLVALVVIHLKITTHLGQGRSDWYEWNDLY